MPVHPASIAASRTVIVPTLFSRQHPFGVAASVGERGGGVDGLVAAARRLPRRGSVGHVAGDDLDARVVRVDAEQREILAQLRGCPHERADPAVFVEETFEDVDAEEPGCPVSMTAVMDHSLSPASSAGYGLFGWSS